MPSIAAGGSNELGVALYTIGSNTTVAAATGATGGTWTEPTAEVGIGTAPAMTTGTQRVDLSGGGAISGGTAALGTTGVWVAVGFRLVPATISTAVNTVEIGAIEWNAHYLTPTATFSFPPFPPNRSFRHMLMR